MNHWNDKLQLTVDDPTFNMSEVSVMVKILEERGINARAVLESASIEPSMLCDPASRISLMQQCQVQRSGAAIYGDSRMLTRIGKRLHLTTYGIAGYALLSSANLNEVIRVAELYSPLLNLKFSLELNVEGKHARLLFVDRYAMDDVMHRACIVLEMSKIIVLLRDVLGGDFKPNAARCFGADSMQLDDLSDILGCEVQASVNLAEIVFDAELLTRMLPQSNASTHAACLQVCDELISGIANRYNIGRQVKDIILKATGCMPTLPDVADVLCMSQRTLRRKLEALNSSYNQILNEVRKELAIHYLTTTHFSTEAIAEMLGYSEAANFRHAFKRWTGASPRHYCASQRMAVVPVSTHRVTRTTRSSGLISHGVMMKGASACWG